MAGCHYIKIHDTDPKPFGMEGHYIFRNGVWVNQFTSKYGILLCDDSSNS